MSNKPEDKPGITFEVIGFYFQDDNKVTLKTKAYSNVDPAGLLKASKEAGYIFACNESPIYCEYGSPDLNNPTGMALLSRFLSVDESKICLAINHILFEDDGTFTFDAHITGPYGSFLKERLVEGKMVLFGTRIIDSGKTAIIRSIDMIFGSKRLPDNHGNLTKEV